MTKTCDTCMRQTVLDINEAVYYGFNFDTRIPEVWIDAQGNKRQHRLQMPLNRLLELAEYNPKGHMPIIQCALLTEMIEGECWAWTDDPEWALKAYIATKEYEKKWRRKHPDAFSNF